MKENITEFLDSQTCASVCCIDSHKAPYCFSCYYAFNAADALLYFKSSADTTHGRLLEQNPQIAGTILPDKLVKLATRGIQFSGTLLKENDLQYQDAGKRYYQKFPLALAVPGHIYTIRLNSIKMTDSTLGFGKKILWTREQAIQTNQ